MAAACTTQPSTPLDSFKAYMKAFKSNDLTTMKSLLSAGTIKMHEKEAKAMGVTVDDIVKRENLFAQDQKTVEYRNEKIDGNKATIEVKGQSGIWSTVPFVLEDGTWKIDKAGQAEQIQKDIEEQQRQLDDIINNPNTQQQQPPPM